MADTVREMFKSAVGAWRVAPSEFWAMSPREWWWLWDYQQRRHRPAGAMGKDEKAELMQWFEANKRLYGRR